MTTLGRVLMVIVVGGALLVTATVATAAAALYGAGSIAVEFQEERGDRYSVRVPAAVADLALSLIPGPVVDEAIREVSHEIEPYVPAIRDAWARLESTEDFVLVEVDDGDDHVVVRKSADRLLIQVDGSDTQIDVAVPIRTLGKIIHKL